MSRSHYFYYSGYVDVFQSFTQASVVMAGRNPYTLTPLLGSGRVGKIVATAAAKHLTPVTLEVSGGCGSPSAQQS